jgi:lipoprotein NlpI
MLGDAGRAVPTPTTATVDGMTDWRMEERDIAPAAMEAYVPDDWFEWRILQLSTFDDWRAVSRWAQALFAPDDTPLPAELQALLQQARALPDDAARVQLLLEWVQREIRYFALAVGESSHRPHPPALVLQRRWGDCKDKTQLLLTLLRRLGIAAEPVLVSQGSPRSPAKGLAAPSAFDHVIARVQLGSEVLYLDATRPAQGVALRALAQPPAGMPGLVADGQATAPGPLAAVPAGPTPSLHYHERVRMDTLGPQATMQLTVVFGGAVAERNRENLRGMAPAQLRVWALAPYERRYSGATLQGEPRLVDDLQTNRLTLYAELRLPEFARPHAGGWRAPVFPTVLPGMFQIPPSLQRQYPLRAVEHPFERGYSLVVDWPEQVSAGDDPQHRKLQGLVFDAESHRSFRGSRFSFELSLKTTNADVAAADLQRWMRELDQLLALTGGDIIVLREEIVAERQHGEGMAAAAMRQRIEGMVTAITRALANPGVPASDRADALCLRAQGLANLDRLDEAARDAADALRLDERSAAVWDCQGAVAWRQGDLARADAAFTRALSLGADAADVLTQRGLVRLLQQRFDAAAQDFERAAAAQAQAGGEHGFARLLWMTTLRRAGQPLPAELQALAQHEGPWPQAALALMADATTPQALLQGLQALPEAERDLALAEAWYYIGQWHLARGERDAAITAFQRSVAQRATAYHEHAAATQELRRLQR